MITADGQYYLKIYLVPKSIPKFVIFPSLSISERTKNQYPLSDLTLSRNCFGFHKHLKKVSRNLIDISFLAVSACVRFPRAKWPLGIWQPCDVQMIVVSIVPDNSLLRGLRVLHPCYWQEEDASSLRLASNKRGPERTSDVLTNILIIATSQMGLASAFLLWGFFDFHCINHILKLPCIYSILNKASCLPT